MWDRVCSPQNTHWHDDDLAGRLLLEQKRRGDQWEILELPAVREEEGDQRIALWPGKYPLRGSRRSGLRSVSVIGQRSINKGLRRMKASI